MAIIILLLVFIIAVFGYLFYAYNRLTQLRNAIETEWSDIDILLTKRHDLIPNIIEVVKGYARHERETLESVARTRSETMAGRADRGKSETEVSGFVASILALKESYPDLKANQDFKDLSAKLYEIEGEIAEKRSNYNSIVKAYNDYVLEFPANALAAMAGFAIIPSFEFQSAREMPELDFSIKGGSDS